MPRWRTKISPALTILPANRFIPKYFGCELRPLPDVPALFVVDIIVKLENFIDCYTKTMVSKLGEFVNRGVEWVKRSEADIALALGVALVSLLSFAAWYLFSHTNF